MPRAEGAPAKKAAAKKVAPAAQQDTLDDGLDDMFVSLDDTLDFLNVVYYGREGSAKTTDLATMANLPGEGKVLVINAEGGLKKGPLQKRGINTANLVIWPNPAKHERVTHKALDRIYRRIKVDLENDPTSWKGVAFDSASEIHTAFLDAVQEKRVTTLKNKGGDVDEDFVDISDYGTMSKMMRDVLRKFRDLPCHFVVTALERRDIDKDTGKPQYGPSITPALQSDLLGYVDIVIMTKAEDEDGPFRGLTRANSRYRAKDRFDILPRVMAEPTFERIVGYLNGTFDMDDPSTDPVQSLIKDKTKKAQDKSDKDDETEDDEAADTDETSD